MGSRLTSTLAVALLEAMFFLENTELGDEVDDAAVELMESIGSSLQQLPDQDRAELKECIAAVRNDHGRPEFGEFAGQFFENFGLE